VNMQFAPTNDAPTQDTDAQSSSGNQRIEKTGMLRVEAPEGFLIRGPPGAFPGSPELIACEVSIQTIGLNVTSFLEGYNPGPEQIEAQRYVLFPSHKVSCEGDVTPSSRCRILLRDVYLKAGFTYKISLTVWNPEVTSAVGDPWSIRSYEDRNLDKATLLDSVTLPGFPINSVVHTFFFVTPSSLNALVTVDLDFNM